MKKAITLILAVLLIVGCSVGGTLAWLTATTDEVVNTFTDSDIKITLDETGAVNNANSYQMIPGWTITKDPVVTVVKDSEDCFLFVEVVKSANFDNFMTYTMADGWTALDGVANVYYREVAKSTADQPFHVIADDTVTVKDTVNKEMMNQLKANPDTYPTLTVKAYAVQMYQSADNAFTPAQAWSNRPTA